MSRQPCACGYQFMSIYGLHQTRLVSQPRAGGHSDTDQTRNHFASCRDPNRGNMLPDRLVASPISSSYLPPGQTCQRSLLVPEEVVQHNTTTPILRGIDSFLASGHPLCSAHFPSQPPARQSRQRCRTRAYLQNHARLAAQSAGSDRTVSQEKRRRIRKKRVPSVERPQPGDAV